MLMKTFFQGGTGKSTITANLAIAMTLNGLRVAVLDADVYGPSQAQVFRLAGLPLLDSQQLMLPKENWGVRVQSLAFLSKPGESAPAIWRAPMALSALGQLVTKTAWGDCDVLLVDSPPGTGDINLSLAQGHWPGFSLSAFVCVTTPQELATAAKAHNLFSKANVDCLGWVENMAYYQCSSCNTKKYLFGAQKTQKRAAELGVEFLAEIPIVQEDDTGPVACGTSAVAQIYRDLASKLYDELEKAAAARTHTKIIKD